MTPGRTTVSAASAVAPSAQGLGMAEPTGSPEQRLTDLFSRLTLHRRSHVAVEVREQGRVGVAEALSGHLRRDAAGKHQRGAGVTEPIRGQPRHVQLGWCTSPAAGTDSSGGTDRRLAW